MRRVTHRESLVWEWWFGQEAGYPEKSDYYLMQVAQEVRRVLSRKPKDVKLDHFLLKAPRTAPSETRRKASKSAWLGAAGLKPSVPDSTPSPQEE